MTIDEVKRTAGELAVAFESNAVTNDVRKRFIAVRTELFQRGIFDPILARFDTATVPRTSAPEIAAQLRAIADSLR